MSWFDELQQASFRGVPFGVLGGNSRFGRKVAVHEYPMRDKPYVEDLGRAKRPVNITGFLVENSLVYGGGSAFAQRDAMVTAAETKGPGILIHPTLGQLTVSVPADGLSVTERWDLGRVFEISFSFIESGDRLFPSASTTTGSALDALADALDLGAASDFVNSLTESINLGLGLVQGVLSLGNAVVGTVVGVAAGFAAQAGQASRDATSLFNLASLLTGNYGRYVNANVSSAFANARASSAPATPITISTLIAQGAEDRSAVTAAIFTLNVAAQATDMATVSSFPAAVQALISALATAIPNPGDAVRLFGLLSSYTTSGMICSAGQIQHAQCLTQDATDALLRRSAIAQLARSITFYVPSSYDDAIAVRNSVTARIDAETLIAGDAGDDASYGALRALRQSVVALLTASGNGLAHLQDFRFKASMPSLLLGQRLYQDASRADQLVDQLNPIHPAFCPLSFRALAN
jgi:prophage DNA circulation protein